uniref:RRM domain-containing protein n=2 Tax=Quercus lobata TaxID=97700 RepID=A0A7N2M0P0_QUELO
MESTSGRLSEADLRGYFGKYGEVMHALVLSDKDRRGFGCVTFKDLETINIVIREESSVDVKPPLCISESIQEQNNHSEQLHNNGTSINKKIFVGRLPSDLTELEFKDYF